MPGDQPAPSRHIRRPSAGLEWNRQQRPEARLHARVPADYHVLDESALELKPRAAANRAATAYALKAVDRRSSVLDYDNHAQSKKVLAGNGQLM